MAAAASDAVMRIRIEFIPPEMYKDCNQEQEFTMVIDPTKLQPYSDGRLAAGAIVSLNDVTVRQVDTNLNYMTPNAKGLDVLELAKKCKIPVALHYEPFDMRLTATNSKNQELWQIEFPTQLPATSFPRPALPSTWSQVSTPHPTNSDMVIGAICKISPEQMYQEKLEFIGPERFMVANIHHETGTFTVHMTMQYVRNAQTKEPLTILTDRVWALRRIALIADATMFSVDPSSE
jgi:hypothetical protein